ncbi:MAG: hypothetical protein HN366_28085, partial [Deltaproteobacteria bacterium]|nr:hypothetical protein [Deltaproteobacteria bacterium]
YIDERFLLEAANQLPATLPDHAQYASVVHLIHVPASTNGQLLHIHQDGQKQEGMGFFAGALLHLARV